MRRVEHLGIAVTDLDGVLPVWRDVLGLTLRGIEVVEDQKVRVAKLAAGDDVIEIFEPTAPDSPVSGFLARRGNGLHHVCLAVDDLDATLDRLHRSGVALIDRTARLGAGGARIAFVHPKSTGGVLIELSEGGTHGS